VIGHFLLGAFFFAVSSLAVWQWSSASIDHAKGDSGDHGFTFMIMLPGILFMIVIAGAGFLLMAVSILEILGVGLPYPLSEMTQ
jgi:hypothetical protein